MFPSAVRGIFSPARTSSTNAHVDGMICMTPQALADDVRFVWKPDSIQASAFTSAGSTP